MHRRSLLLYILLLSNIYSLTGSFRDTLNLEEVEISGRFQHDIYSGLSRIVYSYNHEDIMRMPANNIQGILEYVTALDVRQRGSHGVQADISMRGGSFEQVLILLNGVRINDPQTGHHNMNIPVSTADIKRIEILEGPGSYIYGPNAFSGAINIITKDPGGNMISGSLSGGEYGYMDLFASGGSGSGPIKHYISLGKRSSDGFTGNTDFDMSNIFYRGMGDAGFGTFDFQAGYMDKAFGASNFYSALYPEQYERVRTSFTNLTFKTGESINYSQSVYWKRLHDRFELFRYDAAPWYQGHNYHMTDLYGTHAALSIPHSLGNIFAGAEFRTERIYSSVLGEAMETPKEVKNEENAYYSYHKNREQVNLTAGNSFLFDRLAISPGVLVTNTNPAGWGLYGGIDMSYSVSRRINWIASWNQSLRIPTFTEMYYTGPVNQGNPVLKPEEANTFETGLRMSAGRWRGHTVVFRRKGDNIIDWVKREDELVWESRNITVINTYGIELETSWRRPETMNFPVKDIRLGYAFLDISSQSEEYISAYVLDYLQHKLVAGITLDLHRTSELVLMAVYQDRAGSYTNVHSGSEVSYDPFLLVDVGSTLRITRGIIASLNVSNLFNTAYNDIGNVPVPGRWIKAGVNFRLPLGQ
jgi:vitamin B12 transporter